MMKKIKAVLFDYDGTLMDTNEVILRSWEYTFQTVQVTEPDRETLLETFGEPLEQTMHRFFGVEGAQMEEYVDIYRSYQRDHFVDDICLFPDVKETLQELRKAGFLCALVTSRLKKTTMDGLQKYDLEPDFDLILTADDCTRHKPDPQPILLALERLGIERDEAVMLGDTVMDIGCARNAGVLSILVGWSMALPPEKVRPEQRPEYQLTSLKELLPLIRKINQEREESRYDRK